MKHLFLTPVLFFSSMAMAEPYIIDPPAIYDHPFHGRVIETMPQSYADRVAEFGARK